MMPWLEKIKSIFKEEKKEEVKEKPKIVSLEDLREAVKEELKTKLADREKVKKELIERISLLESNLAEALKALKNFDLSKRKEEEKLKLIVKDNYELYCSCIEKFLKDTEEIKELDLEEMKKRLSLSLNEFGRRSASPFRKATILIGEEMANTRNIINEFIKDLNKIEKDNASLFEELNLTRKINAMFSEANQNEEHDKEINLHISKLESEKEKLNLEVKRKEQKIEKIEKSEEYKKDLRIKLERQNEILEFERNLTNIIQKIDLKILSKYFHFDEKKNRLIKEYKNSFRSALEKDEDLKIVEFVKSAQNIDISKLKDLKDNLSELKKPIITETDEKILEVEKEQFNINSEIDTIKKEIEEELKKKDRLLNKKTKLSSETIELSKKLFPNLAIENLK